MELHVPTIVEPTKQLHNLKGEPVIDTLILLSQEQSIGQFNYLQESNIKREIKDITN